MENGEYRVSLETLFKILSIFQINVAEFFHEEAPPSVSERDVDFLRNFQRLDPMAQREVWDFMRFKSVDSETEDNPDGEKFLDDTHREREKKE